MGESIYANGLLAGIHNVFAQQAEFFIAEPFDVIEVVLHHPNLFGLHYRLAFTLEEVYEALEAIPFVAVGAGDALQRRAEGGVASGLVAGRTVIVFKDGLTRFPP